MTRITQEKLIQNANLLFNPILIESFDSHIKAGPSADERAASFWHNISQAMETIHRLSQSQARSKITGLLVIGFIKPKE